MLQDRIIAYFAKNDELHILFLFDKQGELDNQFDESALNEAGIMLFRFNGNWLKTQRMLESDLFNKKILLYLKMDEPTTQQQMLEFPLLDLLTANQSFKKDDWAAFMQEYQLPQSKKKLVRMYLKDLYNPSCLEIMKNYLTPQGFTDENVNRGLVSFYMGANKLLSWDEIMLHLLILSVDANKGRKAISQIIGKGEIATVFNEKLTNYFEREFTFGEENELKAIMEVFKYNSIVQHLVPSGKDTLAGKLRVHSDITLANLNRVRELGLQDVKFKTKLENAVNILGKDVKEETIIAAYGTEVEYGYYNVNLATIITSHWISLLKSQSTDMLDMLIKSRHLVEHLDVIAMMNDYMQMIAQYYMIEKEGGKFIFSSAEEYIEQYVNKFYALDNLYRNSINLFNALEKEEENTLKTDFEAVKKELDEDYFKDVRLMNIGWMQKIAERDFDFTKLKFNKQWNFYNNYIKDDPRTTVVLIVDAMRYEIAKDIVDIFTEDKNKANLFKLDFQLSTIPSETKYGMAALLPHDSMTYEGENIFVDGENTNSTPSREKILKKANEKSVAMTIMDYDRLGDRDDKRDFFKGPVVTYLYDNKDIDTTGHDLEHNIPEVCYKHARDIASMAKSLIRSLNLTKVIITSDHGFLYDEKVIGKNEKQTIEDETIESTTRYYITSNPHELNGFAKIPLFKASELQEPFYVSVPMSTNRVQTNGSYQFTHGGASLQEIITPVLVVTNMHRSQQEDKLESVKPQLLGTNLKIVSSRLTCQFVQDQAVSMTRKESIYQVGIFQDGEQVSNLTELVMNKTDEQASNRIVTVKLILNKSVSKHVLKLMVFESGDKQFLSPIISENVTNETLIDLDF